MRANKLHSNTVSLECVAILAPIGVYSIQNGNFSTSCLLRCHSNRNKLPIIQMKPLKSRIRRKQLEIGVRVIN